MNQNFLPTFTISDLHNFLNDTLNACIAQRKQERQLFCVRGILKNVEQAVENSKWTSVYDLIIQDETGAIEVEISKHLLSSFKNGSYVEIQGVPTFNFFREQCTKRLKGYATQQGVEQLPCPSPDICPLAQGGQCKPYGRLHVNLDDSDELGTFIFRTTGYNSIRTLAARLSYYHAASNGLLSCLPLQLTLRGKSTTQSYRTPVYYVDLTLREGVHLQEAIQTAKEIDQKSKLCGFNQVALDQVALEGYGNAQFGIDGEEGVEIVEELYGQDAPPQDQKQSHGLTQVQSIQQGLQQSVRAVN
jgi:hypothetical protein